MRDALTIATVLACTALSLSACMVQSGAAMVPSEVAENGTHTFAATKRPTFQASVGALKTLGYEIAFANEASGVIKTAPKLVRTQTNVQATRYSATGVTHGFSRSYVLNVTPGANGRTSVKAVPRVFADGQDISDRDVWDRPGERLLWGQLWSEIATNL